MRVAVIGIALFAGLLLLLPLPLLALSYIDVDWDRLSAIGQSYTAGATIFSAAALIGVAWSLRLQIKQSGLVQGQVIRQFQFELLQLAMSDPLYASVFPMDGNASHDDTRRYLYFTQWVKYFEFLFTTGEISRSALGDEFRDFFKVAENRQWWESIRHAWVQHVAPQSIRHRQFVDVLEQEYVRESPPTGS